MLNPHLRYEIIASGTSRKGRKRVLRGGSWINNARNLRSAQRNANDPGNRNHNIGFRLAGALLAGGSINQRWFQFHLLKRNQGLAHVSRRYGCDRPKPWAKVAFTSLTIV